MTGFVAVSAKKIIITIIIIIIIIVVAYRHRDSRKKIFYLKFKAYVELILYIITHTRIIYCYII